MKIEKYTKKNVIHFIVSIILISLGVALQVKSSIGAGSWDSLNVTLVEVVGYTVGTWVNIVAVFLIIISYIITRKVHFVSFLTGLMIGFSIDFWLLIAFPNLEPATLITQSTIFFLGLSALSLGVSFNIRSSMPPSPIELVPISMSQEYKHSYGVYKTMMEFIIVSIVLFINFRNSLGIGFIGVGTVITTVSMGTYVTLFNKLLNKYEI